MLDTILTGKQTKPRRTMVYGIHGVGKSTFASQAPRPIFIQTEEGLNGIDTQKSMCESPIALAHDREHRIVAAIQSYLEKNGTKRSQPTRSRQRMLTQNRRPLRSSFVVPTRKKQKRKG